MFRKPKKQQSLRRVFNSSFDDEDTIQDHHHHQQQQHQHADRDIKMEIDDIKVTLPPPPHIRSSDIKKEKKRDKNQIKTEDTKSKKSLLSFADDEDDGEVFQVKKSSHSKKVMRKLDKERRKKSSSNKSNTDYKTITEDSNENDKLSSIKMEQSCSSGGSSNMRKQRKYSTENLTSNNIHHNQHISEVESKIKINTDNHTEIRTDDFVLVVKKSDPDNIVLNGRAALCAGRNSMSSEDEDSSSSNHRFSKPDDLKLYLESGSIPDAAMIHAARKKRQKARELGEFVPIEEPKEPQKKGNRLVCEDGNAATAADDDDDDEDGSEDEERVDMNAITGIKEREERREKFYSVQNDYSEDDSDHELNEWENQQIRKGVTGTQLVSATNQETLLSRFSLIHSKNNEPDKPLSTGMLLKEAYSKNTLDKPRELRSKTEKIDSKRVGPQTPQEISNTFATKIRELQELHNNHKSDIENIEKELKLIKLEAISCKQNGPTAAAKYRFYQELRGYMADLFECLDEKVAKISDLEKQSLGIMSKYANNLIERRRQDIRDQAKEMAECTKPSGLKKGPEHELQVRRAAEREGRRTRRRYERERKDLLASHLDGMSSDDEMQEHEITHYRTKLDEIEIEAISLFEDTNDEFCEISNILNKFEVWRKTDMNSYKDAFISLCLPKVVGPLIRLKLATWNPLEAKSIDIEKLEWFPVCMQYGSMHDETEKSLANDPDVKFVPKIFERIIIPKLTEIIENCWDPLSTTQTLRLINVIRRFGRDYPLSNESKSMRALFLSILDKMKNALENDIFIPIFPKQMQEAKTSFFQRQFCSGLKLFRNLLSWQSIISDNSLKDLAIASLLNRYLLSAMRVCTPNDAISKAYVVVNTLPTTWLQSDSSTLKSLNLFITFINTVIEKLDKKNPLQIHSYEKANLILQRLRDR